MGERGGSQSVESAQQCGHHSSLHTAGLCSVALHEMFSGTVFCTLLTLSSAPPLFSSGICVCKTGVYGPRCDECHPGFFHFSSTGCRPCQCHNHTNNCDPQSGECAEDTEHGGVRMMLRLITYKLCCYV